MIIKKAVVAALGAVLLLVCQPLFGQAAFTGGQYTLEFAGDVSVWDISGTYHESIEGIDLSFTLNVDTKGKITGFGDASAYMQGVRVHGDLALTGSIAKAGNITRVALNLKMVGTAHYQGKDYPFNASEIVKAEVDPWSREVTGTAKIKVKAAGESGSSEGDFEISLQGVDGSWDVPMALDADAKGKVVGSGQIRVNGGDTYSFSVTGVYSAKTGLATLAFKGKDAKSLGISLKVTMTSAGNVQAMTGSLLGQKVAKK